MFPIANPPWDAWIDFSFLIFLLWDVLSPFHQKHQHWRVWWFWKIQHSKVHGQLLFIRGTKHFGPDGFSLGLPDGPRQFQLDRKHYTCESISSCNKVFPLYRINCNPLFAFFVFGRKEGRTNVIVNFSPENVGSFGGVRSPSSYTISLNTPVDLLEQLWSGQIFFSITTFGPVAKKSDLFGP